MPMALSTMFIPRKFLQTSACSLVACLVILNVAADDAFLRLGRVASDTELAELPTHVFADGSGLPEGSGDTEQGKEIYTSLCADCHGSEGQGGSAMELVGDRTLLATEYPDRGIAVYWPYAPTLFEYIQRAMPPDKPYSLSDTETYSVIARLLELNGLIDSDQQVNAAVLSALRMPNEGNFRSGYVGGE